MRKIRRLRSLRWTALLLIAVALVFIGGAASLSLTVPHEIGGVSQPSANKPLPPPETPDPPKPKEKPSESSPETASKKPDPSARFAPVDVAALDRRVQDIASGHAGFYGVAILDPESGKTVALNADETFGAASIGKLPALITLYRAASRGELSLENSVSIQQSDYQLGTGVLQNEAVGYTVTLRECAYLMVNESDNTAWEMLHRYLGWNTIEAETYNIGARSTGYWDPNTTTPNDVLLMLRRISAPSFTSGGMSSEMLAAMTDTVNEDRIPEPLPPYVRVAHKFGSYGDSFGDAGVVFYEEPGGAGKRYFIVVLSEGAGETEARDAMRDISLATYQAFTRPEKRTTQ